MSAIPAPPSLDAARAYVAAHAHDEANRYPMMDDDRLRELAADIRANGQRLPIVIHGKRCLDGRNRWVACLLAGVDPLFAPWDKKGSAADYVDSHNLHRRDLSAGQRAMIACGRTDVRAQANADARARQAGTALEDAGGPRKAAEDVAVLADVSVRTVEHAIHVRDHGVPDLVAAVVAGQIPVAIAADVARAPAEDQQALVDRLGAALADPDPDVRKVAEKAVRKAGKGLRDRDKAQRKEKEHRRILASAGPPVKLDGVEIRLGVVADVLPTLDREFAHLVTCDPPWRYSASGNGAAKAHYGTMDTADIVADIAASFDLAKPAAYLLVWATHAFEEEWHEHVLAAKAAGSWRWTFCTGGSWGKPGIGVGTHARGASELWHLYTKGRARPFAMLRNHYDSEVTEHSGKPLPYVADMLRAYCPGGGQVLTLYAGHAPEARAALASSRRCLAIEADPKRHAEAVALLRPAAPLLDVAALDARSPTSRRAARGTCGTSA